MKEKLIYKKEELEEFFRYDVKKNILEKKWKRDGKWRVANSSIVNSSNGYVQVGFFGRMIQVNRLIYILVNGNIPDGMMVGRIDNDKTNNNINNLQLISRRHNKAKSSSGLKPNFHKSNQSYQVQEKVLFGKQRHTFNFGCFKSKSEAQELCNSYNAQFGYGKPLYDARESTPEYWRACMINFKNFYLNNQGEYA